MSWKDEFQEGSFRGAGFYVTESRASFGRRNKPHEYPQRDTGNTEDLGRRLRRWSLEVFVLGDDYFTDRDALIAATEADGPGTLIHPYLGTVQAILDTCDVVEATAAGGMATFSMQFVEYGQDTAPSAASDTQGAATTAAAAVAPAIGDTLTANLDLSDGAVVQGAAQGLLANAGAALTTALAAVQPLAAGAFAVGQTIAGLTVGAAALLAAPDALATTLCSAFAGVAAQATTADGGLGALSGLITWGADLPPVEPITPTRAAQAGNQTQLVQAVQCAAAQAAVTVVAGMDFASYDDAVAIRDPLGTQLDCLATSIADNGDDELAGSIDGLRLAMIADVTARGASLARLYAFTPAATEPAVVISQRLYGDAEETEAIVARNGLAWPGFVPGGVALEVLSPNG
jgi:prophage DNA circulation protein